MIGKASHLIKQINNLISELQNLHNPDLEAKKTQIRAISEGIHKIEKSGVPVPNDLIIIQEKLQSELKEFDNPDDVLLFIADEMSKSIEKIRSQHVKLSGESPRSFTYKGRISRDTPTTSRNELKKTLIETLKEFGGSANLNDIQQRMAIKLKSRFTPADVELLDDGVPRWQKNIQWLKYRLTLNGILKDNSPRGIWELVDKEK
jgi:hypothetical protein